MSATSRIAAAFVLGVLERQLTFMVDPFSIMYWVIIVIACLLLAILVALPYKKESGCE